MKVPGWSGRIFNEWIRPHFIVAWLSLFCWVSPLTLLADPGRLLDRLHPPPDPTASPPSDTSEIILFQRRQALLPLLYRDRQQDTVFSEIAQAFDTGRTVEALQLLQQLFDADEDSFYWPSDDSAPISIRTAAHELLLQQTPAEWELYEQLNAASANHLLEEAHAQHNLALYHEVARRYAFTSAGLTARRFIIHHALDRHRFHEAHQHASALINSDVHHARLLESDRHIFHFLHRRIESDSWNESPIQDQELRTAMVESEAANDFPVLQVSRSQVEPDYFTSVPPGTTRTHWQDITPPYLKSVWSASHTSSAHHLLDHTLKYWEEEQVHDLKPAAVGWKPVVVDKTVYVRSYDEVTAFDLASGEMQWKYPCHSKFSVLLENFRPHGRIHSRTQFAQMTSELNLEQMLVGNNLLGTLTHDEERLYLIDNVELEALKAPIPTGVIAHADNLLDESEARRRSNRLVALPLHQAEAVETLPQEPVWSIGGALDQQQESKRNDLAGHFILGPPLVDGDTLYVLAEFEQQINLIALEADSGHVLWKQGIGWVEFMIDQDVYRSHRKATPILAHNLLLCPCQTGMLVAVDRASGSLKWVYDYRELSELQQNRHWTRRNRTQRGHIGFDDAPVVQDDRVLFLSHQSENLHCLDLHTGNVLWKRPRKDAEYIGLTDQKLAFVVGRKSCRGISLTNGTEIWSTRLGTPSGSGTHAGRVYLLPLQSGQIASINIQTGEHAGLSHLHDRVQSDMVELAHEADLPADPYAYEEVEFHNENTPAPFWSPGNLIACPDYILSAGPRGVTLFPQAGSELYQNPVHAARQVSVNSDDARPLAETVTAAFIRQAELNLILDRLENAQYYLERCLETKETLPAEYRITAERLLQEVLYARLRSEPAQRDRHYKQLETVARTTSEQGRLLMEEAEFQLANGSHQAAWKQVVALAEFDLNLPMRDTSDPTLTITPRSWIPLMRNRLLATGGNAFAHLFDLQCQRYLAEALSENNEEKLHNFLTLFGEGEEAATAQLKLAAQYLEEGEFHLAEQLWLSVRESASPQLSQIASRNLVQLWKQFGMYQLAAAELDRLHHGNDAALRQYVDSESDCMLRLSLNQIRPEQKPVARVRITEDRWTEENNDLSGYRLAMHPATSSDFTILTKGSGHTGRLMTMLDRMSGTIRDEIEIPAGALSNQLSQHQLCGTQLCLGGSQAAISLSLLTRKPVWEMSSDSGFETESLSVYTINSQFTVLRNRRQLAVVDTGSGSVYWQRDDVSPPSTRITTGHSGVLGDSEALVMFEDQQNYTVFDTRTGEELREGQLTYDPTEKHYHFGRKLFFHQPEGDGNYLCLYDPLTNEYLLRRHVTGSVLCIKTTDEKIAILTPLEDKGHPNQATDRLLLEIIDPITETFILNQEFGDPNAPKLSYLRVFDDRDHYYVNLQHHEQSLDLPRQYYPAGDTLLDNETIRGEILAFSKQTGELVWSRSFQPASVIRLSHYRLPVLLLVSRTRDRMNPNLHSLAVEAVDTRTGKSLGFHDEILTDRLVYGAYDPDTRRISLVGHRTAVHFDLLETEFAQRER
ncbi:MAG: hypothetical protein CMJ46_02895 [Planctomyces sp.]|nr:hypothetical protein [Planctomyces sp.]